ncbi:MAG TPA: hypothetical protein VNA21_13045, partial [Steroidobacteraceae bacterium]|nr:hypothetical protein [Steroidobacteraceae bacterium]
MKAHLALVVATLSFSGAIACEAPADVNDDMVEATEVALFLKTAVWELATLQQAVREFALSENLEKEFERWDQKATRNSIAAGYTTSVTKIKRGELGRSIYLHNNLRSECVRIIIRAWD